MWHTHMHAWNACMRTHKGRKEGEGGPREERAEKAVRDEEKDACQSKQPGDF
jgi:hypothetical protein